MSHSSIPQGRNLFLTDEKRKAMDPREVKAKATAPVNLAIYKDDQIHPVVQHVLNLCASSKSAYQDQWSNFNTWWQKADNFYWMAQKKCNMPELTRANVSASTFYITSRRLADGAYTVTFPTGNAELPISFFPTTTVFDTSEEKRKRAMVSEALNQIALESMRKNNMGLTAKKAYHSVYKYATGFAYVPWDYEVEKRKRWKEIDVNIIEEVDGAIVYTHAETGEQAMEPFPFKLEEEIYDHVVKDGIGFHPLKPEAIFADSRIEDLDRQTCFLWRSDMTRPEIWRQVRAGNYKNEDRITELQKFQLFNWESQVENTRKTDAGQVTTDSMESEVYERWQAWILLPKIKVKKNKAGEVTDLEWDQNGEECRYLVETIGKIDDAPVVVRFQESPYWGNGIPFIVYNSHEDDVGLYKRGLVHLMEDNMTQEQVAKGQLMDNRTLLNFRPLTVLSGRVRNKSFKIGHNTVFQVTSQEAIKQLQVADLSATIAGTLNDIRNESQMIAQVPKFMIGQEMGGRTSATEFAAIRDQSSAPGLNDIRVLNLQIFGAYLRKLKSYIPQFLDRDVYVKFQGENGQEVYDIIKSEDFSMDMDLKEIAVTAFDSKQTTRQIVIGLLQSILSNPVLAGALNPMGLLVRIFSMFPEVFPNPEELINKDPQIMDTLKQYQRQIIQPKELGTVEGEQMAETGGQLMGA